MNPGAPLPAENAIEALYQYFEGGIPQIVKRFDLYSKENHAMKAIIRLLLPQPVPKGLFYRIRYNNRSNLTGYFTAILDHCVTRYAKNFARRAAGELDPCEAL